MNSTAKLTEVLAKRKSPIIKRWFDHVVKSYPPDASTFLKNQKDPFANPVGSTTFQCLEGLFDQMLDGLDVDKAASILDPMIRIRAVQDFTASRAVAVIFAAKRIIREIWRKELNGSEAINDLLAIESRIDEIGLIAFDLFMKCREKIYELQAKEARSIKQTDKAYRLRPSEADERGNGR
jgi:hypothetical protein